MSTAEMSLEKKADLLLNDPAALANHSCEAWQHLPREEVDAIQLAALRRRFALLRDSVPVLKKLADAECVTQIDQLNDAVPLLFEHTVFKSYPPSLLEKKRFGQINKWLGKLVTPDIAERIAAADVSGCQGLDEWFAAMDRAVPELRISHTSGTSGTVSFLPNSVREWEKAAAIRKLFVWKQEGADMPDPNLHTVYPYFHKGYLSHVRANEFMIRALLPGERNFHPAYPATLSSDMLHLGAKIRAAHARGTLDRLEISPDLLQKKKAFDKLQAETPQHLAAFFEEAATKLRGKRVYIGATWNLLHGMAKAGLERGLEGMFHPDSFITTTGGAKGVVQPEGWREDVLRFTGVSRLNETYAMSELVSGSNPRCEHGEFPLHAYRDPVRTGSGNQQASAARRPCDGPRRASMIWARISTGAASSPATRSPWNGTSPAPAAARAATWPAACSATARRTAATTRSPAPPPKTRTARPWTS
ncbi:hypothetical protein ACU4HD_10300 [Cupriavidus basilensis]